MNAYGMPKEKASIIIDTFEGRAVDWGVVTGRLARISRQKETTTNHTTVSDNIIPSLKPTCTRTEQAHATSFRETAVSRARYRGMGQRTTIVLASQPRTTRTPTNKQGGRYAGAGNRPETREAKAETA